MHVRLKDQSRYTVIVKNSALALSEHPDIYETSSDPIPNSCQYIDYICQVPGSVTPLSMRRALRKMGLYDQVSSAVAGSNDDEVKDAWEYAIEFSRDVPMVNQMAEALNISQDTVDQIYVLAKTFE